MDKKIIRLTESDIHKIVKESVEKIRRLYESDELEMGTDEEFDAFMQWATTDGSDMFSSAANEYVNNGDESKLYVLSIYYAREVGLNQNVAFNIAKEAAEGIYGFLGGMQVVDTRNANEAISRRMKSVNEVSAFPNDANWRKKAKRAEIVPNPTPDDSRGWKKEKNKKTDGDWYENESIAPKNFVKLTESDLRYLIKETVQIVLEGEVSDFISKFHNQVMELESQHNELYKQDNRLTSKINYLKKIMKDYPEEAHLHENELNEMIAQRDEIRKKKAEIRAQIKQLQNERNKKLSPSAMRQRAKEVKAGLEPLPSLPGRDVTPKSLWKKRTTSRIDARRIERNNWAEERYKEILTNGFLLVPKAKEATVMSDGRRRFVDLSNPFNKKFSIEKFKEFVGKNHPEKIVKSSLIPRKRERNQLDDVEYYDMKVFLEDNPNYKPNTPNPNAIQFSPEDVPTGKRSISFSPEDMPDYTY